MPTPAEAPAGKKLADADGVLRQCTALEGELNELKTAYEQYFLGMERRAPTKRHEALKKAVAALKGVFLRQTSVRFRVETLAQKLLTYERLWERSLKEIEDGTYRRDVFKARRHRRAEADEPRTVRPDSPDSTLDDFDVDVGDDDGDDASLALARALDAATRAAAAPAPSLPPPATSPPPSAPAAALAPALSPPRVAPVAPARPPGVPATSPPRPSLKVTGAFPVASAPRPSAEPATPARPAPALGPASSPQPVPKVAPVASAPRSAPALQAPGPRAPGSDAALSDGKLKAIYDAYVLAKRRCGEDTSQLSYDSVATSLRRQVPELMRQHKAKSVEFKVVIKDGKAILRALPKE